MGLLIGGTHGKAAVPRNDPNFNNFRRTIRKHSVATPALFVRVPAERHRAGTMMIQGSYSVSATPPYDKGIPTRVRALSAPREAEPEIGTTTEREAQNQTHTDTDTEEVLCRVCSRRRGAMEGRERERTECWP